MPFPLHLYLKELYQIEMECAVDVCGRLDWGGLRLAVRTVNVHFYVNDEWRMANGEATSQKVINDECQVFIKMFTHSLISEFLQSSRSEP